MNQRKKKYTELEKLAFSHPDWRALPADADKARKQKVLDGICNEVVSELSPAELCANPTGVYHETAEEYFANPRVKHVIDELVRFMDMIPDRGDVLDIGCGYGRDTMFMTISCEYFRKCHMERVKDGKSTLDKYPVSKKTFRVVGIDGAPGMIREAGDWAGDLEAIYAQVGAYGFPKFVEMDMHNINIKDVKGYPTWFDGIWSCTSLFTHTPYEYLDHSVASVAELLYPDGGIFFVSYTNGRAAGGYNKLILSSTGRIKWFSQPDPEEIIALAGRHGLRLLEDSTFNDYIHGRDFAKDLFVSHFFTKK